MTQEEKAKAYDEAYKKVAVRFGSNVANEIFLKESEDEKIRKALIRFHKSTIDVDGIKGEDVLAWLEKAGEQKPVDKVEPKFHEGEWVIFNENHNSVYQVERIDNYRYYLRHYLGGSLSVPFDNELIRKWTIQDAKDGDVLATDSWLYIFKYTNNKALIQFHCTCPINRRPYKWCFFSDSDDSYLGIYVDANIHPATKEQRDLLFQKMHEAGYMWNSKSKQLLSLKAEPSGKQKPDWSEEDESRMDNLCHFLDEYGDQYYGHLTLQGTISWLKSIKDRYTWKPSEEQMEALDSATENCACSEYQDCLRELLRQLKKLREE